MGGVGIRIEDGEGKGVAAGITSDHLVKVTNIPSQSREWSTEQLTLFKVLRVSMVDTAGSADLVVDGSSVPVEFFIKAAPNRVYFVTGIRVVMHDQNMDITTQDARRFGSATSAGSALPNGVTLHVEQGGQTISLASVTRLIEFLDTAEGYVSLPNAIASNVDFVSFDFIFQKPITLLAGSTDRLVLTVRDDLTSLNLMAAFVVRGYQEFTD